MDGTVNCANREDGRPAFAGADAAADAAGTGIALAGVGVADMGVFSFTTAAGGAKGAFARATGFAATLTGGMVFAGVLATALALALATLGSGLADFTATALVGVGTVGLAVALAPTFAADLTAGLTAGLTATLLAALAAGLTALAATLEAGFAAGFAATAGTDLLATAGSPLTALGSLFAPG